MPLLGILTLEVRWWASDWSDSAEARWWASGRRDRIPHQHLSGVGHPGILVDKGVPGLGSGDGSARIGIGDDSSTGGSARADLCDCSLGGSSCSFGFALSSLDGDRSGNFHLGVLGCLGSSLGIPD